MTLRDFQLWERPTICAMSVSRVGHWCDILSHGEKFCDAGSEGSDRAVVESGGKRHRKTVARMCCRVKRPGTDSRDRRRAVL